MWNCPDNKVDDRKPVDTIDASQADPASLATGWALVPDDGKARCDSEQDGWRERQLERRQHKSKIAQNNN